MLMIDTGNTLLSKQHKRATPKTPEASPQSAKYKAKKAASNTCKKCRGCSGRGFARNFGAGIACTKKTGNNRRLTDVTVDNVFVQFLTATLQGDFATFVAKFGQLLQRQFALFVSRAVTCIKR